MSPATAIGSLPVDERRAMTLQRVYGYRYVEIAARLNMPLARVTALLAKAARHYTDALESDDE